VEVNKKIVEVNGHWKETKKGKMINYKVSLYLLHYILIQSLTF